MLDQYTVSEEEVSMTHIWLLSSQLKMLHSVAGKVLKYAMYFFTSLKN